jgi:hypothetical protein
VLKVTGTSAFLAKLKKANALVRGTVSDTHRKLVTQIFTDLVMNSPQWSGNLAQQWSIDFHGSKGAYRPIPGYGQDWQEKSPYHKGSDPAVGATLARELRKVPDIKWNTKVTITNYAPYASDVENNIGPDGKGIRPENKLESYGKVAMVAYVTMKYSKLRTLKKVAL